MKSYGKKQSLKCRLHIQFVYNIVQCILSICCAILYMHGVCTLSYARRHTCARIDNGTGLHKHLMTHRGHYNAIVFTVHMTSHKL